MTQFRDPDALVSADWLVEHLDDPDLRIFDCSTRLEFEVGTGRPYKVVSGLPEHQLGHIPGAMYLDLQGDFSDPDSPYGMTLPAPDELARAFERHGVGDDTRVILYSRRSPSWATRFWWMLRWLGFDNAAILDGGFEGWVATDKPVSTTASDYPSGRLTVSLRPDVFVGRDEVLQAIGDGETCTINALDPGLYAGQNSRYGRPGRIPGSVNVPKVSLTKPDTLFVAAPDEVAKRFIHVGADKAKRQITYCGGGIFATFNAFLLYQLGYDNVAVYDNSLSEWAPDSSLPIETD